MFNNGISYRMHLGSIGGRLPYYFQPPLSKKSVEGGVEFHSKRDEAVLEKGGVLFILTANKKNIIPLAGKLVAEELPVILHITTSELSPEEKIAELGNLKLLNSNKSDLWIRFVSNMHISPELTKRIRKYGDPAVLHARRKEKIKSEKEQELRKKAEAAVRREKERERFKKLRQKSKHVSYVRKNKNSQTD